MVFTINLQTVILCCFQIRMNVHMRMATAPRYVTIQQALAIAAASLDSLLIKMDKIVLVNI